ncbi:MAG: hypothetical protein IPN05_12690 [Sulfuritalea sp.]|nr:hypothetical protein [Sulfuritalea sp.]
MHIINGESATALGEFLRGLEQPALFWLDAHYSAGVTAMGALQTPVKDELRAILSHRIKRHHILIDDVKDFNGQNDYPTVAEILDMVQEFGFARTTRCVKSDETGRKRSIRGQIRRFSLTPADTLPPAAVPTC